MRTSKKKPLKSSAEDKSQKKRRNIELQDYSKLNQNLISELDKFVESVPSARLSKNLRNMFVLYISYEYEMLPSNFKEFVDDLYFLLNFLDAIGEELPDSMY